MKYSLSVSFAVLSHSGFVGGQPISATHVTKDNAKVITWQNTQKASYQNAQELENAR